MRAAGVATAALALCCATVFTQVHAQVHAQAQAPAEARPPVLIGGSIAQSGMLADLAREYIKGIELWRDDVNARGGLAGRQVELRLFDDGSGARRAAEVTRVLIEEDKVDLLFGPFGSPAALEAAVVADRARRIMLNATGTTTGAHSRTLRYMFQLMPPPADRALPVLKLAEMLGTRTLTVFAGTGASPMLGRLREEAKVAGVALAESSGLPVPSVKPPNYPPLIAKIDPKSVLLVFDDVLRLVDLVREMKLAGFRAAAFVAPEALNPEYIKRVGMDAEYSFGLSAYEPRARTPGNQGLVRAFQAMHKQPPGLHAASGWAAGQLLEAGVARAGGIDTEALRGALAKLETETVLGAYRLDASGTQRGATTMLVQIQKGRREVVWPEGYRSAEPVLAPPPWPKTR